MVQVIKRNEGLFCCDCEIIYSGSPRCPICGNDQGQARIGRWIVGIGKASIKAEPIDLRAGYQEVQPCI